MLSILGRLYCSELRSEDNDERDNKEEDAIMELEYERLVASGGEAEPLWVEKFGGALRAASYFRPQRNRRPTAKAMENLQNV
jgi:hypothetical protein